MKCNFLKLIPHALVVMEGISNSSLSISQISWDAELFDFQKSGS